MPDLSEDQLRAIREEASFRTQVLERLDQLFSKVAEIFTKIDDLNLRKADKTAFTSFETIQTAMRTDLDALKNEYEDFKDNYKIERERIVTIMKIIGFLLGGVGVLWPIIYLYAAKYWLN